MKPDLPLTKSYACTHADTKVPDRPFISRRTILAISASAVVAWESGSTAFSATGVAEEEIVQPQIGDEEAFMHRALEMRQQAIEKGDRAYGAVIVRDRQIIGQSWSKVVLDNDPTAHAEIAAIRDAARRIGASNLDSAVMYSSSRPCPMCEAAAYWAGIIELIHGESMNNVGPPVLCR